MRVNHPVPAAYVVMTFNVLRGNYAHQSTVQSIANEQPDILCLQELSPSAAEFVGAHLRALLPHQELHPYEGIGGCGVLSRFAILDEQVFSLPPGSHICQHVVLDCPGRPIGLLNIHLSAPKFTLRSYDCSRRDREAMALVDRLAQVPSPLIVAGDFNMTPAGLGYVRLTTRLRDAYREAGTGAGFTFPHAPRVGGIPIPMWPAPFPVIRIDYIFHCSELRAEHAYVGRGDGSDHLPVIARLRLAT